MDSRLRFSRKSVQAPSCKRPEPETTQRTLFLSFESISVFAYNGIALDAYEKIQETCMPHGQFKHRYWYFVDTPNISRSYGVICKRFMKESRFLPSSHISGRMYSTILLFQISVWCEKFVDSNDRNRVRWVVLGLSQYGASTGLFENFSEKSIKGDLSNDTTLTLPLFSLANTFKAEKTKLLCYICDNFFAENQQDTVPLT